MAERRVMERPRQRSEPEIESMPKLAICIPTFNRSAVVRASLERLADLSTRHDIVIHVSDNCSTDDTGEVVRGFARDCARIRYHRNATNVGMDRNFAVALGLPDTPYMWLLGDDDFVSEAALRDVLMLIDDEPDLILLNGGSERPERGRVQGEPSRAFDDPERLLDELGWHATWISGLVVRRRLLEAMRIGAYAGSYFSHFIALFEGLRAIPSPRIRWYEKSAFYPSPLATFSWDRRLLEIFALRWSQAVWTIPADYADAVRRHCIRAHGVKTGLFTAAGLLNIRAKGGIDLTSVRQYRSALAECSPCPWGLIAAISVMPTQLVGIARRAALALRPAR